MAFKVCEIAPDLHEDGMLLRALDMRGEDYLYRIIGSL